jgi:hypothetical protein
MPNEIVGVDYALLKSTLLAWRKSGLQWADYRNKLEPTTQETIRGILIECRRNGFAGPHVEGESIIWWQIISDNNDIVDKCTLCNRNITDGSCNCRTDKEGNFIPCWK